MRVLYFVNFIVLGMFTDLMSFAYFEQPVLYCTRIMYLFMIFAYPPSALYHSVGLAAVLCTTLLYSAAFGSEIVVMVSLLVLTQSLKKVLHLTPIVYGSALCVLLLCDVLFVDYYMSGYGVALPWTLSKIIANIIIVFGVLYYKS